MRARGRGWALSIALMELSSHRTSNPVMAATARQVIAEVLEGARESQAVPWVTGDASGPGSGRTRRRRR